ncbi:MAG TPA: hypothetical protein VIW48_04380, partial [Nitrospiraceae bacterium]
EHIGLIKFEHTAVCQDPSLPGYPRSPPTVSVKRISLFARDLRDLREKRDWSEVSSSRVAPVVHVLLVSLTIHHPVRWFDMRHPVCQTRPMTDVNQDDVNQALAVLGLTLPVTPETLDRAKRVQLYTWNPARYSNLTNNPKKYMQAYKKAEEMTKLIEASYTLLTAVLVPDEMEG